MISAADMTGWIDELAMRQPHVITAHAAIASLAIIILFILAAQLLSRDNRADSEDDQL